MWVEEGKKEEERAKERTRRMQGGRSGCGRGEIFKRMG